MSLPTSLAPRRILFSVLLLAAGLVAGAADVKNSVTGKNIHAISFMSESLGEERSVSILLPPDYDTSTRRYPTLYLLHGYGDDNTAWSYMTNLSGYGAHHEMIIVMPDGSKSFYVNSASDPKARFEDFITKDLVAYVDSHYRTIPQPRARAIAGLSMGGYGAAELGLKHAHEFSALGSFSGAVGVAHEAPAAPDPKASAQARRDRQATDDLLGPVGSPARADHDPFVWLDKVAPADLPFIYVACGGEDFLVEQNRAFVRAMAARKIPYEYREISPRVHAWDFWDDQIRIFLNLLDQRPGWGA